MKIKLTNKPVEAYTNDVTENLERAATNVMEHINEYGGINITEYSRACRHYIVNRDSLFVLTHPYNKWCMDCGIITTQDNWDQGEYRCKSCAEKYREDMKGFVMQKYHEGYEKLFHTNILHAIKYAGNYEADLYLDGKLIMSPLGLNHDDNAELLEKHGLVRYYKDGRLKWKHADESKNIEKLYMNTHFYKWEGEKRVQINVKDYPVYKDDYVLDTHDEVKEFAEKEVIDKVKRVVVSCYIKGAVSSYYWTKEKGWHDEK